MTLGETIRSIDFSKAEKNRLSKTLRDTESLQYKLLSTKIYQIKDLIFWQSAHKKFKIKGFREGHQKAIAMILSKALDSVKNESENTNDVIWPLYRMCAIHYVSDDLKKLNHILLNEVFEATSGSLTKQIFSNIADKRQIYDCPIDEVEKLYDIWGFERVENLADIISSQVMNANLVKRIVSNEIQYLRTEINRTILSEIPQLREKIKVIEVLFTQSIDFSQSVQENIENAMSSLRSELENVSASIVKMKSSDIAATIKNKELKVQNTEVIKQSVDSQILINLQNKIDKLSKKVQYHSEILESSENIDIYSKNMATPLLGNKELHPNSLLVNWLSYCEKHGQLISSTGNLLVLLEIIRSNRILISDKPQIFEGLIKQFPRHEIKHETVNPLWLSGDDWKLSLSFISQETNFPRILVINDFDVALQELYLVPSLINWLATNEKTKNRVILVPSKNEINALSARILEISAYLDSDILANIFEFPEIPSLIAHEKSFLQKSNFNELLSYSYIGKQTYENDLRRFVQNSGILLPTRLLANFVQINETLLNLLDPPVASALAFNITLSKWLKKSKGESVGRVIEENIKATFGIV